MIKSLNKRQQSSASVVSHRFLWDTHQENSRDLPRCTQQDSQGKGQSTLTQFTAGDLLQHEREKVIQAKRVSKPALCLQTINGLVWELCQCHCVGLNDSGVQSTTKGNVCDVWDREAHAWSLPKLAFMHKTGGLSDVSAFIWLKYSRLKHIQIPFET